MTGKNLKLGLVNVDVHTKFGQILSIHSQDIERKRNFDVNQGPLITPSKFFEKKKKKKKTETTDNNPKLGLVHLDVHTKFGEILSICSQDIERKRNNSDVNQGP